MSDSARGERVTRNRAGAHRRPRSTGEHHWHPGGGLLTLLLVAPAAAVLTSRLRGLLELDRLGAACTGTDLLGPLLLQGLPVVVLIIAIPAALLSLAHRATGWTWLLLVLGVTALLEVGLRVWLPQCA